MTKTMKNKMTPTKRTGGFTLIEMLVVAALIAIFAGLAVFNVVEQLNREKEKAALAEARSIATAMSFAYDDMGFFPKICFLRFGVDEFLRVIGTTAPEAKNLSADAIDWFGVATPASNMGTKITNNWGEKYMSGSMPDKYVEMRFPTSGGAESFDWPADPFRQPYMAYLIKAEPPANSAPGTPAVIDWANDSLGDKPNYFAGIVSYGRNKVPGLRWDATPADINNSGRAAGRLYTEAVDGTTGKPYFTTGPALYNQARLDLFVTPNGGTDYNMREAGSDDKYFEF